LTAAEALDLAHDIAGQVAQAAAPLEESGEFERAAHLYDQAARAFEIASEKVPSADRERVAASGELWTVKADVTRYRVYTAPPASPEEQPPGPGSLPPLPEAQPTDTHPPTPSRPAATVLDKPVEVQDRPWTVTTPASSRADSTPPTAIKKPGGAGRGQWSIAQTSPLDEESETPEAILRKLNRARKKPPGKEDESPYQR
jgi:hypothetical protein